MALIESLLNLYRVDGQVRALRSRLDAAQRYLDAQTRLLGELNQDLEELRRRKKHLQASVGNTENEIAGLDERIEKIRGELNKAVTNKQYNALLNELNGVKDERSRAEDRVLQDMEQIESIESQVKQVQEQIDERTRIRDVAQAELEERRNDVGHRLAELEAERQQATVGIPSAELDAFNQLAESFDGEAMAAVEEINRRHREYACGACNMQLPFEQVSLLMSSGDSVVRCPACTRILYLQDEVRGSLAKK